MEKSNDMIEAMITYALLFVGVPYKYGGDNPLTGLDCSGLVLESMRGAGLNLPDMRAQDLYNQMSKQETNLLCRGCLLFFGKSAGQISHVAIALDNRRMIEAGGGDSTTVDLETAKKQNAFVRIRPIRKDLVGVIMPHLI